MIKNFKKNRLVDPKYIHPFLATYEYKGKKRDWEILEAHDSVAILIYHKEREEFILVKQFRPAVYVHNKNGMTLELCAGLVDKELSLEDIAKEEIEEECGYKTNNIEKITSFYTSVGFAGAKQTLYYSEVTEEMKVSSGGGVDSEDIEVIYLKKDEIMAMVYDETIIKTPGLMFAFLWWFERN